MHFPLNIRKSSTGDRTASYNRNTSFESSEAQAAARDADWCIIWLVTFVVITSLIGLAATVAGVFRVPQVILISLLLTGAYGYACRNQKFELPGPKGRWPHILLLILVALIFRVPPYHYVLGGQDEGLYTNISHYIEETGGINVHDNIYRQLKGTPYEKEYTSDNSIGTSYVAGVYKTPDGGYIESGALTFQFYHMFPVWMATFEGIFGSLAGVYALTALSLLSIILFYRLALLLSGSYNAGLLAGGLIALNPLHAFFSKFPVTEVPALCFALVGFTFLAAYWSATESGRQTRWLLLSILGFLCVFTTRISGFMYIPFFIALGWAALLLDKDRSRARALNLWAVGATGAYLLSVVYGYVWSYPYSRDIYRKSFSLIFGVHWDLVGVVVGVVILVAWIGIVYSSRQKHLREVSRNWLTLLAKWLPVAVVWAALLIGILKIYELSWTQRYTANGWLGDRWHLADLGWVSVTATSLWTLIVFAGPFMVIAFLAISARRLNCPKLVFMHWFVAGFFAYALVLEWVLPYTPYYARYLLSELLPYMILFVVCVWSVTRLKVWRHALTFALVGSLLYGGILTAAQIGKSENKGAYASLSRLVAPVGPSDIILLDAASFNQSEVKTALLYTFHRHAMTIKRGELKHSAYLAKIAALYNNVFFISRNSNAPDGFTKLRNVRYKVMQYKHDHSFPHELMTRVDTPLTLYRLNNVRLPVGMVVSFAKNGLGVRWLLSGWSYPETWGTWSSGHRAVISIDSSDLPLGPQLSLHVVANVLVNPRHPVQNVLVSVNDKPAGHYSVKYPQSHLSMSIPLDDVKVRSGEVIIVTFTLPDAIAPKKIGINSDSRVLALGLKTVQIQAINQR